MPKGKLKCNGNGILERTVLMYSKIRPYVKQNMKYLEIGCGYTRIPLFLFDDKKSYDYTAIDIRGKALRFNRKFMPDVKFVQCYAQDFLIEEDYDFIVHFGIADEYHNVKEIHHRILSRKVLPSYVYLETGQSKKIKNNTNIEHMEKIVKLYQQYGFSVIDCCDYLSARGHGYRTRKSYFLSNVNK